MMKLKRRMAVVLVLLIMVVGCATTANAKAYSGSTCGYLGQTSYIFSVDKTVRGYDWAIKYSITTGHRIETMKLINMMCEYANGSNLDYADKTAYSTKSLSYEGAYGTTEIVQAVAHFYIISYNFGNVDEIGYYK